MCIIFRTCCGSVFAGRPEKDVGHTRFLLFGATLCCERTEHQQTTAHGRTWSWLWTLTDPACLMALRALTWLLSRIAIEESILTSSECTPQPSLPRSAARTRDATPCVRRCKWPSHRAVSASELAVDRAVRVSSLTQYAPWLSTHAKRPRQARLPAASVRVIRKRVLPLVRALLVVTLVAARGRLWVARDGSS